jgi:hypothetical protein
MSGFPLQFDILGVERKKTAAQALLGMRRSCFWGIAGRQFWGTQGRKTQVPRLRIAIGITNHDVALGMTEV